MPCPSRAGSRFSRKPRRSAPTRSRRGSRSGRGRSSALLKAGWPADLPTGIIHADLFPDNVFFIGEGVSGLIDFYFACTDAFAYDVAICLNAWCFEADGSFNLTKGRGASRRLSGRAPARGVRDRCVAGALPRLRDAIHADPARRLAERPARRAGEPKDPLEYDRKLHFHRRRETRANMDFSHERVERVQIYTDGACSGNPGPGGWAAILSFKGSEKEISGGEEHTTNNRMELLAAIEG